MSERIRNLSELPIETIDVQPADSIEALTSGHGMTEIAASCNSGNSYSCTGRRLPEDDA
ncbi:thiomuracin/GE37468 family thiazolyl RiPP peptide [Nonomuraea sp. NPDC001699]